MKQTDSIWEISTEYLNDIPGSTPHKRVVRLFLQWMDKRKLSFEEITPSDVKLFARGPLLATLTKKSQRCYRLSVARFWEWLHQNQHVKLDPQALRERPQLKLPGTAKEFTRHLEVTLKPNTCGGYKSTLRAFHHWLKQNEISLKNLQRHDVARWLNKLYDDGSSASSRANKTIHLRLYFRWLNERRQLRTPADELVKSSDIPKLPKYLPRPFSPDADRALKERLGQSDCLYQQALLLMRNTGIRIGELMSLERDCIHADYSQNSFLKVPLGKLNNERLVPLDASTLELARKLQCSGSTGERTWLIETKHNKKTRYGHYQKALLAACDGLQILGRVCTHRLRHTYATSLLNGGMSLAGVMKLLGHKSVHMTLLYAAVTGETVVREYHEAMTQLERRYSVPLRASSKQTDPEEMINDIIRWINRATNTEKHSKNNARTIVKRLERIQSALREFA